MDHASLCVDIFLNLVVVPHPAPHSTMQAADNSPAIGRAYGLKKVFFPSDYPVPDVEVGTGAVKLLTVVAVGQTGRIQRVRIGYLDHPSDAASPFVNLARERLRCLLSSFLFSLHVLQSLFSRPVFLSVVTYASSML
jgi:hypothetical protein